MSEEEPTLKGFIPVDVIYRIDNHHSKKMMWNKHILLLKDFWSSWIKERTWFHQPVKVEGRCNVEVRIFRSKKKIKMPWNYLSNIMYMLEQTVIADRRDVFKTSVSSTTGELIDGIEFRVWALPGSRIMRMKEEDIHEIIIKQMDELFVETMLNPSFV